MQSFWQSFWHFCWRLESRAIYLVFLPAGLGLLFRAIEAATVADRLLAIALILFCLELAHMAQVDLENAAIATASSEEDSRLSRFYRVVVSTIVLETTGFYIALFSLQWGAVTIIASQIWFNLLAGVQIFPQAATKVVSFGIAERIAVLAANAVGLGILSFWFVESAQVWLASGVLTLIVLFLIVKYKQPARGTD
ncbi:MAG: hypothetical protein WBA76_22295 [Phormidesmis sp.]